ncbi:hypothetical protein IF2G_08697 [Cordyceps javanica]|nr:hypothetical protein IF2G_08697 [Cordyceps javanica]
MFFYFFLIFFLRLRRALVAWLSAVVDKSPRSCALEWVTEYFEQRPSTSVIRQKGAWNIHPCKQLFLPRATVWPSSFALFGVTWTRRNRYVMAWCPPSYPGKPGTMQVVLYTAS